MALLLNMPGFCIYQGSEYARILIIPVLWIFEGCEIPQFQIYKGSEYTGVTLAAECTWISLDTSWICLIMCDYARMLNTSLILSWVVSLRSQFVIFENSTKINLHWFHKMPYLKKVQRRICIGFVKLSIADVWQSHDAWYLQCLRSSI